ncbi:mate-domain-containing protein [Mycena haematopus]|nr:mate-domain-containing protein [Mycena haematopus]
MAEPPHHLDPWWTDPYAADLSDETPLLPVPKDESETIFHEELVNLIKSGLPIFGTHLLEYSLITASVVTTGHLSTTAMSAGVSGFSIIQGLSSALDTVLPSAWTSQDPTMVGVWTHRMGASLPMFVIWFESERILLWLRQDPEIARLAGIYLHWSTLGLPAYAFNCVSRRYFQSQGLFAVPTQIIMIVAPINAFLNWLLVLGPAPIRLGYIGAPIATAVSFNLVSLLSLAYAALFLPEWNRLNQKTAWHPVCRRSFQKLGILVHLGGAGVGPTSACRISPLALAAQSVLLVAASTAFQAPFALGIASSVRIGNLLGEGLASRARVATHAAFFLGLVCAGLTCAAFLLFRRSWAHLFTYDPPVVALVAAVMPLVALLQFFDATSGIMGGVLRARGKQVTGALLNLSGYYIIGLPIGMFLAFYPKTKLGLYGLWIGLMIALGYAASLGMWVCLATDWDMEVEKVRVRLAAERRLIAVVLDESASEGL